MNKRDKFLDAMEGISEEYLIKHVKKKSPTRADKLRRYTGAAALYAAACLVLMVSLPFIIGHGNDPQKPGDDPIVTETVVPGSDSTTEIPPSPVDSVSFNGCEYTITLDKTDYTLSDTVTATVTLENKGDETVVLYQGYLGDYLDEVMFYEDGVAKPSYYEEYKVYPEAIQARFFEPGDKIIHTVSFIPGAAEPPASMDSLWVIVANVVYLPDPPDDLDGIHALHEEFRLAAVSVTVPHGETENPDQSDEPVFPAPAEIVVGAGGKSAVLKADSDEYDLIKSHVDRVMVKKNSSYPIHSALSVRTNEDGTIIRNEPAELKANETFIEYVYTVYNDGQTQNVTLKGDRETEEFRRIMFPLTGEHSGSFVLAEDVTYGKNYIYKQVTVPEDLIRMIGIIVDSSDDTVQNVHRTPLFPKPDMIGMHTPGSAEYREIYDRVNAIVPADGLVMLDGVDVTDASIVGGKDSAVWFEYDDLTIAPDRTKPDETVTVDYVTFFFSGEYTGTAMFYYRDDYDNTTKTAWGTFGEDPVLTEMCTPEPIPEPVPDFPDPESILVKSKNYDVTVSLTPGGTEFGYVMEQLNKYVRDFGITKLTHSDDGNAAFAEYRNTESWTELAYTAEDGGRWTLFIPLTGDGTGDIMATLSADGTETAERYVALDYVGDLSQYVDQIAQPTQ